jgi:hypothetical protein
MFTSPQKEDLSDDQIMHVVTLINQIIYCEARLEELNDKSD